MCSVTVNNRLAFSTEYEPDSNVPGFVVTKYKWPDILQRESHRRLQHYLDQLTRLLREIEAAERCAWTCVDCPHIFCDGECFATELPVCKYLTVKIGTATTGGIYVIVETKACTLEHMLEIKQRIDSLLKSIVHHTNILHIN